MKTTTPKPVTATPPDQYFHQWNHFEKDYIFSFSMLPPGQTDNFFWFSYRAGTPLKDNFWAELAFPGFAKDLGLPAEVGIQVYGATDAQNLDPDHHFDFYFDGNRLGDFQFDGKALQASNFLVPPDKVKERGKIGFATPEGRENAVDSIYMDWMNVRYPATFDGQNREYFTFNNDLLPQSDSTETLHFKNLPAGATIFDPGSNVVWQLAPDQTSAAIPNSATLTTYTIAAPYARMTVDGITYTSSTTTPTELPADLQALVIYHPDVAVTAENYTRYRQEGGWNASAVSILDVYSLYSHGFVSDDALKRYVSEVKQHAPGLSHLVLIGDAHFDYREARTYDDEERHDILVPIHWVHRPGVTWSGGYQDDNWYGSFANEFRPDIAVGRIAVNNDEEGMEYLRKVIEHETFRKTAGDQGLLISSVEKSFQQYVSEIGTTYKDQLSSFSYLFPVADEATKEVSALQEAINSGVNMMYYVGHGGSLVWRVGPVDFTRQKDLFTPADVAELTNKHHYPMVVCASCYTTSFDQSRSIGEALVNQPGAGAIAVIGAPWKATVQESHDFNRHFFQYYFDPSIKTIGEASLKAHRDHIPEDQAHALFNSFTLLGDPCLEIVR